MNSHPPGNKLNCHFFESICRPLPLQFNVEVDFEESKQLDLHTGRSRIASTLKSQGEGGANTFKEMAIKFVAGLTATSVKCSCCVLCAERDRETERERGTDRERQREMRHGITNTVVSGQTRRASEPGQLES